jgi:GNAT superfamily N-acetyltransferase
MNQNRDVGFRMVTRSDVSAMAQCRLLDPDAGAPDPRMEAYFDGKHHPQHALPPRTGYVAMADDAMIGYIAGHRTNRHGCDGEVQYLFVAPRYRRRGIGSALLRLLADWFHKQGARKVCVGVADDSPTEARPFVESVGATPLKKHWYAWDDIGVVSRRP